MKLVGCYLQFYMTKDCDNLEHFNSDGLTQRANWSKRWITHALRITVDLSLLYLTRLRPVGHLESLCSSLFRPTTPNSGNLQSATLPS
ncbi:hypothetical protein D3C75_1018880 [compost metagenome]